jgi:hypothetical protein
VYGRRSKEERRGDSESGDDDDDDDELFKLKRPTEAAPSAQAALDDVDGAFVQNFTNLLRNYMKAVQISRCFACLVPKRLNSG